MARKSSTAAVSPWWRDYFSAHYGTLYRGPLEGELSTEDEVAAIARLFAGAAAPVLDLGCGYGRHLAPARRAGVPAVGLDFSAALLGQLPRRPRCPAARGDMRRLPFRDGALGGAWLLFNTFGYFDDGDNAALLAELARVLAPGARLLMDAPSRPAMVAAVAETPNVVRTNGDITMIENWRLDDAGMRLESEGRWTLGGESQLWTVSVRLHTAGELARLLARAGFAEVEIRPLEEIGLLGTGEPGAHPPGHPVWRRTSNMAILATRRAV